MAKNKREWLETLDKQIIVLHDSGVAHSTIFHTTLFLILALTFSSKEKPRPPICLNFQSEQISEEILDDPIVDISELSDLGGSEAEFIETDVFDKPNEDIEIEELDIVETNSLPSDTILTDLSALSSIVIADSTNNSVSEQVTSDTPKPKEKSGGISESGDGNGKGNKDFEDRLTAAGAQTGDIQISIAWENTNDIDVWVVVENKLGKFPINWTNRIGPNGGFLDIDMNVMPTTNKAVENIFWPIGAAPEGKYTVYIQHYWQWDQVHVTPVRIRILVDGKTVFKKIPVSAKDGLKKVYSFYHRPSKTVAGVAEPSSGSSLTLPDGIIGPHLPIGQLWSDQ